MSRCHPFLFRCVVTLALGLLAAVPALAQLDPRLQAGSTDFLDLFQQSSSNIPKPEILSIFDYSRSMASLMSHPLYRNDDKGDKDDYRYMEFSLKEPQVVNRSTYTILIEDADCVRANSAHGLVATTTGVTGYFQGANIGCRPTSAITTAPLVIIRASAAGNAALFSELQFSPTAAGADPTYAVTGEANYIQGVVDYRLSHADGSADPRPTIEVSPASGPYASGSTLTFTVYVNHPFVEGEDAATKLVSWQMLVDYGMVVFGTPPTTMVVPGRFKSQWTVTLPGFSPTPGGAGSPTELTPITVTPTGSWSSGQTVTCSAYYKQLPTGSRGTLNWYLQPIENPCPSIGNYSLFLGSTTGNTTLGPGGTISFALPGFCAPPAVEPYVAVSLNTSRPSGSDSYNSGAAYVASPWVTTNSADPEHSALRKPDGSPVTLADVDAVAASSTLYGSRCGRADIRNWLRAASHVRFSAYDGSVLRTIDLPIPWKIMDGASRGNPLSSQTVKDEQWKDGVRYGSGLNIETDQSYKVENAPGSVFSWYSDGRFLPDASCSMPSGAKSAVLYTALYRPAYISWLFLGKYQSSDSTKPNYTVDGSLAGNYIVFDALNKNLAAGQADVKWGQGFGPSGSWGSLSVPQYNLDGTYKGTTQEEASSYRIPALTRLQATKRAAIQTWIAHQADVYWAFRCLDSATEAGAGAASSISNDSQSTLLNSDATTTHVDGTDSGWTVMNNSAAQGVTSTTGNSVVGMSRIASLFAKGETPLTYAMARSLAQFGDPKNVFNRVVGTDVPQCGQHFLLLFTDGVDNNGQMSFNNSNTTTPYLTGSGLSATLDILQGNKAILASKSSIDRSGSYWNIPTFAGIAAHLSNPSSGAVGVDYLAAPDPGTTPTSGSPSSFLPFAIKKRNGVFFNQDHQVTTMTIGVNLGGLVSEETSPKRSLFLAAVLGRSGVTNGALSAFHPFRGWNQALGERIDENNDWIPDPRDPTLYPARGMARDNAVYFFDATNPDLLSNSLEHAFLIAISSNSNQATAAPTLPFIGASLGRQLYTGQFYPPSSGGVLWPGDLLSFGTQEVNGTVKILDNKGIPTTTLSATTALWSASAALLKGPIGTARKLYTRIPGGTDLQLFKDSETAFDDATTGLKIYVATSLSATTAAGLAKKKTVIQLAAGADITKLDSTGKPTANRLSIMGDIINSAPAAMEYSWSYVNATGGATSLSSYSDLTAVGGNRFRLILVGTNQGWLHAFGEVTKSDASGLVTGAAVQELWSFMPTDFLAKLDYLTVSTNRHRFMVDGSPTLYHLDLPPTRGGSGNGVVDSGERAVAVFGLGKGGRSYYALNVLDPFNPTLKWALVPDEVTTFSPTLGDVASTLTLATVKGLLDKFGFSTSPPAIGRIVNAGGKLRDAVFLGGGFSTPEVEANFKDAASRPTPLGRSVMALDVNTGYVLAAADLSQASATAGPIGAGLIPFEFVLNSGLAQRAYFLDYKGGLWAWGSNTRATEKPFKDFRVDSSKLSDWTLRKVYQDDGANNARYTTLPAPFRVGSFPGMAFDVDHIVPAAVGIAMVSGDRNNPLDSSYSTTDKPTQHRLTMVFDRQDSNLWGLDTAGITSSKLKNFTDNTMSGTGSLPCVITPGCNDYYLAPRTGDPFFGYYVNFPAASGGFVPKGINPPLVVAGSLFYSIFTPTSSDVCLGGAGNTQSWVIQDVLNPLVTDSRTTVSARSGLFFTWPGAASDFIPIGTRGVLQGGMAGGTDNQTGTQSGARLITIQGNPAQRFVRPRVWRTVD